VGDYPHLGRGLGKAPLAADIRAGLQEGLENDCDARREDRFLFIGTILLLLDAVFFTVMPSLGDAPALVDLRPSLGRLASRIGKSRLGHLLR
jgi:hypothetical protein